MMSMHEAVDALRSARCLAVEYGGYTRRVEVHAVGFGSQGQGLMEVWQVDGGSSSGVSSGWKLMRLDDVASAMRTDQPSLAPRPGYRRSHRAMTEIIDQV
ncbi:hypothetical protein MWN34_05460 [Ancylobacter sp. 6x-1]|uniref:WYL domain-containing protein n=1 Tax=Ancylobacter crimeensis TaxID=2579147 RepID=A0ABT0D8S8_9HYPH|nr:hypothetical protein [Ancylobacter crimeensis]MCK0196358.1 hypothetical protein [Ancylobacter crimeensis]